jgi:uncharacterized protein (DUF1330 family)/quinol monooxygenase YgiN
MQWKQVLLLSASLSTLSVAAPALAQEPPGRFIRLAELEIDPSQLDQFNAAIKEGIEAAVRLEPGVLALHAVAETDTPTRVRVFEMYTDANAYQMHLETPHFRKFRDTTDRMVTSRKLLDAQPIALAAKPAAGAVADRMPSFYVSEFEVTDREGMKPYSARVDSTFEPFGGRYVVRGGKITPLEGEPPKGVVVIAFDSVDKAQAWYDSVAYREIRPIRHRAAKSRVYVVEGTQGARK